MMRTTTRRIPPWLTIACLCFCVNALALTGVAQLRLAHGARSHHHLVTPTTAQRIPLVGGVANGPPGPPNPGPWLPQFELVVGDSITVGLLTTSPNTAFPLDVEALAGTHQAPGEIAHSGWTTTEALAALPATGGAWPPSLAPVYRVEVVELGTNDWARAANTSPTPPPSLTTFQAHYAQILRATAAHRDRLICLSTWHDAAQTNSVGVSAGQYDTAIAQLCAAAGGTYVSLQAIYQMPDSHCPLGVATWVGTCDGWHPGDVGARRIAQAIVDAYTSGQSGSLVTRQRTGPRGPQGRGERWPR